MLQYKSYFNNNKNLNLKLNYNKILITNIIILKNFLNNINFFYLKNYINTAKRNNIIKIFSYIINDKKLIQYKSLFFSKYYFVGLGFKMFVYRKKLFVWVGLTHYTILKIPSKIFIFAKKKRIFIISKNLVLLKQFLMTIRSIKKRDIYKGKGLLEIKTYKGFTIMKTGKKKQY